MLLYEHPLSSYAQKVKIALREKGLDFTVETPPALGSGKADGKFAAASPRNEVPALVDGDVRIFDSTIILEYLEDKFPSPPLLPSDPAARANARMIEELCDTLYEAVNWGLSEIRWFKRAEGEQAEKMTATAQRQTADAVIPAVIAALTGAAALLEGSSLAVDAQFDPIVSVVRDLVQARMVGKASPRAAALTGNAEQELLAEHPYRAIRQLTAADTALR